MNLYFKISSGRHSISDILHDGCSEKDRLLIDESYSSPTQPSRIQSSDISSVDSNTSVIYIIKP